MKLGVLGGTFDPVHNGHLAVATVVRDRLRLHRVLFVPAGQPQLKPQGPLAPAGDRLQMLRLAIAGQPDFAVSTIEMDRPGATYTVDTIAELSRQHGGDQLFFILGWDSLERLPEWREPARIASLCWLVAVPRPGCPRPDLARLEKAVPGISGRVVLMDEPHRDVSASAIRDRVAKGLSVHGLVPDEVERYIDEHGLYRRDEEV